jgi:uncharacterized protein (TIGR03790 family)
MRVILAVSTLLLALTPALAQPPEKPTPFGPNDVWVVCNSRMPESRAVAEHYLAKRGVPADHLIALPMHGGEEISRPDYERQIRDPLRERLKDLRGKDFILLTTYGVPFRIQGSSPKPEDAPKLVVLRKDLQSVAERLKETEQQLQTAERNRDAASATNLRRAKQSLQTSHRQLEARELEMSQKDTHAAVDSELALMWWKDYRLYRWQINPRYFSIKDEQRRKLTPTVLTCRIDGPSPTVAKRIIDDALAAEAAGGPKGTAYVDARGIKWDSAGDAVAGTYGGYDESIRELADLFKQAGLTTTLDNRPEVFAPGTCPNTALYCGWYSLDTYVPAFSFEKGSIAVHIASGEAVSLRIPTPRRWVPNLLENGACVSLGPVAEPYLIAFPKPPTFFGFLLAGDTLVESYWLSSHFTSWQIMLIGDPLYRPFGKEPKLKMADVKQSPKGSRFPP